jgi:hypothetical protein
LRPLVAAATLADLSDRAKYLLDSANVGEPQGSTRISGDDRRAGELSDRIEQGADRAQNRRARRKPPAPDHALDGDTRHEAVAKAMPVEQGRGTATGRALLEGRVILVGSGRATKRESTSSSNVLPQPFVGELMPRRGDTRKRSIK